MKFAIKTSKANENVKKSQNKSFFFINLAFFGTWNNTSQYPFQGKEKICQC